MPGMDGTTTIGPVTTVTRNTGAYKGLGGASVQCVSSGTINYTVQWSNDSGATWTDHDTIAGATASASGVFHVPVQLVAVNVNSVSGGTVTAYLKGATK